MGSPITMAIEQHYTVKEVARALKLSQATMRGWIKAGKLRAAKLPGRFNVPYYAIPESQLQELGVSLTDLDEAEPEPET